MSQASQLLEAIADVGCDRSLGGYSRPVFSAAESELREWFVEQATRRDLQVETDPNGLMWAWWGEPGPDAVVTGSHLDSVPGGGAYDGPLGVVSALDAVDRLRSRGVQPRRPFAIAVFPEEEGSRFGVACLGSRLLAGTIDADRARGLTDADGVSVAEAYSAAGLDPAHLGADPDRLGRIGRFVELHVEQGRGQVDLGAPVALASSILGHGRWRLSFRGQGNHAGTTPMDERADPTVAAAEAVLAVRRIAAERPGARGTVGRLRQIPGGTNVIASSVDVWLDVRHEEDAVTAELVERIGAAADQVARAEGCVMTLTEESVSATAHFDAGLRDRLRRTLGDLAGQPGVPVIPTGAGHDAGVLAGAIPTAMLFVRNPTGISHAPEEAVEPDDVDAGVEALTTVLTDLVTED